MTLDEKIAALKAWAVANYENGADTFVECWDRNDYVRSLERHGGDLAATQKTHEAVASVYLERQADARNSRW